MAAIEAVGIVSKPGTEVGRTLVPRLHDWFTARAIRLRVDHDTAEYDARLKPVPRDDVPEGVQLVVVLGGDGTLLSAARAIAGRDVPLFAVNLGGLGFLTAITFEETFLELERVLRGEHQFTMRRMLDCRLMRAGTQIAAHEALNDAVVTKATLARMVNLDVYVDEHFVSGYKADGLIVSTPTGSTAYSLAAGGPIIYPEVAAFAITPICPHTLTNRPVIVPDDRTIAVVCRDVDDATFLTIDGQVGEPLKRGDRVECRRSVNCLKLVRPPSQLFFDVLRAKLKWGQR